MLHVSHTHAQQHRNGTVAAWKPSRSKSRRNEAGVRQDCLKQTLELPATPRPNVRYCCLPLSTICCNLQSAICHEELPGSPCATLDPELSSTSLLTQQLGKMPSAAVELSSLPVVSAVPRHFRPPALRSCREGLLRNIFAETSDE